VCVCSLLARVDGDYGESRTSRFVIRREGAEGGGSVQITGLSSTAHRRRRRRRRQCARRTSARRTGLSGCRRARPRPSRGRHRRPRPLVKISRHSMNPPINTHHRHSTHLTTYHSTEQFEIQSGLGRFPTRTLARSSDDGGARRPTDGTDDGPRLDAGRRRGGPRATLDGRRSARVDRRGVHSRDGRRGVLHSTRGRERPARVGWWTIARATARGSVTRATARGIGRWACVPRRGRR